MSTARINRLFLAGARQAEECRTVRCREPGTRRRPSGTRASTGSSGSTTATRRCSPIRTSRPSTSRCRTRCTSSGRVSALEAGKHVLCEKPLSRHAPEVERAFDVAEREGRLLMEAFMYRHNPQTQRLTELVGAGAIGRVRMIRGAFSFVAARSGERPAEPDARRRGADGRRLLLRQRRAAARGRARAAWRRAGARRRRRRCRHSPGRCGSPTT